MLRIQKTKDAARRENLMLITRRSSHLTMLLALAVLCTACTTTGTFSPVERVIVTDYGAYKEFGLQNKKLVLKEETLRIPAMRGAKFGVRYQIQTDGPTECGELLEVKVVPENNDSYASYEVWKRHQLYNMDKHFRGYKLELCQGEEYVSGFFFPFNRAPIPGIYIVALINENAEILLENKFEVYEP